MSLMAFCSPLSACTGDCTPAAAADWPAFLSLFRGLLAATSDDTVSSATSLAPAAVIGKAAESAADPAAAA